MENQKFFGRFILAFAILLSLPGLAQQKDFEVVNPYGDNILTTIINAKGNPSDTEFNFYQIVRKNKKYGIYNTSKSKYYKEPIYDSITSSGNYLLGKKWNNIVYGNPIVEVNLVDDEPFGMTPNNPAGVVSINRKKYGLKKTNGQTVLEADYDEIIPICGDVFSVKKGKRWGFATVSEKPFVFKPQFDYVMLKSREANRVIVATYNQKKEVLYNPDGTVYIEGKPAAIPPGKQYISMYDYSSDDPSRRGFSLDGKFGMEDEDGNEIVKPMYDFLKDTGYRTYIVGNFSKKDSLYGLIDKNGKLILPVQFREVDVLQDEIYKASDKKIGLYDREGKVVYPPVIDSIFGLNITYTPKRGNVIYYKLYEHSTGKLDVLKIENNKPEKILEDCEYINFIRDRNVAIFKRRGDLKISLYDAISEKMINSAFTNVNFDERNLYFTAATDKDFNTIIDLSLNTATARKPVSGFANGYFFYLENGKMHVMDKDFRPVKFSYKKLEPLLIDPWNNGVISFENAQKVLGWFKFSSGSQKYGVIDFNGNVLIPAEKYDSVKLLTHYEREHYPDSFYDNPFLADLHRQLKLLCENNRADGSKDIVIKTLDKTVAAFRLEKDESWAFAAYNNGIIIKTADGIKLFDIPTQKIIMTIKSVEFTEDYNGGFTSIQKTGANDSKRIYTKYSIAGNPIGLEVFNYGVYPKFSNKKQYISKKNNLYGVMAIDETILIPFENDSLFTPNDKYYVAKKNNLWTVRNLQNEILLFGFDQFEWKNNGDSYSENQYYFTVTTNGKKTVYDYIFKPLFSEAADKIDVAYHHIIAQRGNIATLYSFEGKNIFSLECDQLSDSEFPNPYAFYRNGKQGLVSESGKIILPANYSYVWPYADGLFMTEENNKKVMLDGTGKVLAKGLDQIQTQASTLYPNNYKLLRNYFSAKNETGKAALFDNHFKMLQPFEWDDIYSILEAKQVLGKKNGKLGVTDIKGKTIIPFIYDDLNYFDYCHCFTSRSQNSTLTFSDEGVLLKEEKLP